MRFYELKENAEADLKENARYMLEHQVQAKSYLGKANNSSGYEDGPNRASNYFTEEGYSKRSLPRLRIRLMGFY